MIALLPPPRDEALEKIVRSLDEVRAGWLLELVKNDKYLCGEQELRFLSEEMRKQFGHDVTELVLNFPELIVDAHNDRLDVVGFRFPGESSGNQELWDIWQANDMDEKSVMAHEDALGLSRAAVIVGADQDDPKMPIITVESAFDVSWKRAPRTGAVIAGYKRWVEDDKSEWMSLYEPDQSRVLTRESGVWRVVSADRHMMGRVPIVPLVNRPRTKRREGRSEFASVLGLSDAANKTATDMMQSVEYHAMPRRWAFGLKRSDFVDANGNSKGAWSFIKGRLWANENPNVKVGQFPESDLSNFHNTIKLLARLVAQLTGMPIDYLSFDSVNPPSADALRSAESRLVKRVERRQVSFGGSWEEVMRLALYVKDGGFSPDAMSLEAVWADPATPTIAQRYDAIVKAVTTRGADGRPLVPTEQGRIDLGYSPAQRLEMLRMEQEAVANDPLMGAIVDPSAGAGLRG